MSKSIRINKKRGYTVIPNGLLPEGKITARAWGIYAYLLSRPNGWVIHVRQLQQIFKEGRDAIYAAMKQLREVGLLEMESYREPGQPPKKRYVMADIEAILGPDSGKPDTGNQDKASPDPDSQDTGFQDTGNQDRKSRTLTTTDKTTPENNQLPASLRSVEPKDLSQKNPVLEVPLSSVPDNFSGDEEKGVDGEPPASRRKTLADQREPMPEEVKAIIQETFLDKTA